MPEGHTLHRIAKDHRRYFMGQRVSIASPQGRFEKEAKLLSSRTIQDVQAYGKHLAYEFSGGKFLHVHLGLYGKFRNYQLPAPEVRGAVRVRLLSATRGFDLNGPNTCEVLAESQLKKLTARIGPDPLRKDSEPELAWKKIQASRSAIGALLLNQAVIAGLGNIYRAEILFLHGIHPDRPSKTLSRHEFEQIWDSATRLLKIGVRYNRIITDERPESGKPLSKLNSDERLLIYKKPVCPRCGSEVVYWELGNRTIYACEHCQG